jgi:hypothetical protein
MSLSDLQKKLEQEARGIMFPFNASASTVNTTQNVYNSATDGIMTMQGKKYVGPDSVIKYGSEEQGYARQLKQIEAPMLPQFDETQFPKAGEGIVQTPTPAPTPPVETEPETPAVDPCPPGFKLIDGVCRPIESDKSNKENTIIDRRRNIGDTANALGQVTNAINSLPGEQGEKLKGTYGKDVNLTVNNDIPWLNFIPLIGKPLNMYLKNKADKQLQTLNGTEGISVTKNKDGTYNVNVTEEKGKANFGRLQTKESLAGNMASTQKKDAAGNIVKAPNGQNMIQGPLTLSAFGKTDLFAPTTRTPAETDSLNAEEKNKLLSELDAALGLDSTATASKPVTVDPESTAADATARNTAAFGEVTSLDKSLQYFGQLNRDKDVLQMQIDAINKELAGQNVKLPQVKAKYADYLDNKKKFETKLKNVENEITKAEQDAKNTEEKLAKSDRQTAAKIASDYNSRVGERAEKRQKEFEEKQRIAATKSPEQKQKESKQRTENFKKMTQSIRNFDRR